MGWIQEFVESIEDAESPPSYFYWSLLTTISAVAGKKIWLDRGGLYKLYPNIYTFLVSKRSGLRKGVPINIAKKLAHEVGKIRVVDGQNSIQGVIKELAKVRTVGNGHLIRTAEGFLISGEFASFLLQDGIGFSLTTLTDLYDTGYHEHNWKKKLASEDEIELKSPYIVGLFASNETHFFDAVPKNAISGGFLARTFCIYEEKRNKLNSLTGYSKPVPKKIDYLKILGYLSTISQLEGQMIIEEPALKIYDEWYYDFSSKEHDSDDETATSERLGDNILKAAMLLGLANNLNLEITVKDIEEAIVKSMETFNNIKRLLLGGSADGKNIKSLTMRTTVATLLGTDPVFECERKVILRKGAGVFGVYDLDECIEHLMQAGMIKQEKRGSGVYYKLTDIIIKKYQSDKGRAAGGLLN